MATNAIAMSFVTFFSSAFLADLKRKLLANYSGVVSIDLYMAVTPG
jgi:hypothetical protein